MYVLHMLHAVYYHMLCALGIAAANILCTAICLCHGRNCAFYMFNLLYCHMLCAMGTAASCMAYNVLIPQIYCYTTSC